MDDYERKFGMTRADIDVINPDYELLCKVCGKNYGLHLGSVCPIKEKGMKAGDKITVDDLWTEKPLCSTGLAEIEKIAHMGKVLVDLIPRLYDEKRIMSIKGETMNKTIAKVFQGDKLSDAEMVDKHYGAQIREYNVMDELGLTKHKEEILQRALDAEKRLNEYLDKRHR